jgi:hypothetical protein
LSRRSALFGRAFFEASGTADLLAGFLKQMCTPSSAFDGRDDGEDTRRNHPMDHDPRRDSAPAHSGDSLKETAVDLGDRARDALNQAAEPVQRKARSAAQEQKDATARQVDHLGAALHGAAGEIEKELPGVGRYIHSAADSLQNASSALRERSIEDLLGTFNQFARKQPLAAFGGAVLAGFAFSRFLTSTSPEDHRQGGRDDHG